VIQSSSTSDFQGLVTYKHIVRFIVDLHWKYLQDSKPHRQAQIYHDYAKTSIEALSLKRPIVVHKSSDVHMLYQTLAAVGSTALPVPSIESPNPNSVVSSFDGVLGVVERGACLGVVGYADILKVLLETAEKEAPDFIVNVLKRPVWTMSHISTVSMLSLASFSAANSTTDLYNNPQNGEERTTLGQRIAKSPSQSDLVSWPKLDSKVSLASLHHAQKLTTINTVAKPIEAFRLMIGSNVGAVPIVDNDSILLNYVALRDVAACGDSLQDIGQLYGTTVGAYAQGLHDAKDLDSVVISMKDTCLDALSKLVLPHAIGRLWIVDPDNNNKVMGVLTIEDFVKDLVASKNDIE
jgi:CBS domain-containing protein